MILVNARKEKRIAGEKSLHLPREDENSYVQIVGRSVEVKGDSGEISNGNEKQVIEN